MSNDDFRSLYWQKLMQTKIEKLKATTTRENDDEGQQIALKQQIDMIQQVIMRINRREKNLMVN